uniref:OSJNBa0071G03.2 protein n=1 Tax=Oryza sativa subsp. japonica TaxID=39947 RepID=Q7X8K8_ORYSJ|nr:OSJNBa0071G03.2 [Oryza sativa Japonica Group]
MDSPTTSYLTTSVMGRSNPTGVALLFQDSKILTSRSTACILISSIDSMSGMQIKYVAISRTATSIGVREIILLVRWSPNQYVAISRTATSIGVREMILHVRWSSNQYVAIPRTATSDGRGKLYSTSLKTPCLYGSTPRSTKASTTNVDKAPSQTLRLLDYSRTERHSVVSDLAGHELEEEGYPVVDYESDVQTVMSTTVR